MHVNVYTDGEHASNTTCKELNNKISIIQMLCCVFGGSYDYCILWTAETISGKRY